jgi:enoyl-CoA hydratase/3-hydroxyacyl-CoA dehydrogenase
MSELAITIEDRIARIELDRPHRHNAVNVALKDQLEAALDRVEDAGDRVGCLVVAGRGRSLCSGADLSIFDELSPAGAKQFMLHAGWSFRRLERLPVPVVAAAKGYCLGGGLELLLHCDVVVASETAQLGFPEVALGLVTTAGSVSRLMAAVGSQRAKEILLGGRRLAATEAREIGLVSEVTTEDGLDSTVMERARALARQPRPGVDAMKQLVRGALHAAHASWVAEMEAFENLVRARHAAAQGGDHDR